MWGHLPGEREGKIPSCFVPTPADPKQEGIFALSCFVPVFWGASPRHRRAAHPYVLSAHPAATPRMAGDGRSGMAEGVAADTSDDEGSGAVYMYSP